MPWCPVCRTEYDPGRSACTDCGAALVDDLPPEEPNPVVVFEANSVTEAQVAEATLEAEGIAAFVSSPQSLVPNVDPFGDEPTELEVMVSAENAERAVAILSSPAIGEEELGDLAESTSDPNV